MHRLQSNLAHPLSEGILGMKWDEHAGKITMQRGLWGASDLVFVHSHPWHPEDNERPSPRENGLC